MRIPTNDVYWGEFVASEKKLGILGDVRGKRILEIGCGSAQNSIALAKWGAHVCAVDFSRMQVRHAHRLAKTDDVEVGLSVGDMNKLPFRNETFDMVITAVSLQYVQDLVVAFSEVNRVLPGSGHFVFSGMHPLSQGKLARYRGRPVVAVSGYFRRRTIRWSEMLENGTKVRMYEYYRTLRDYFEALAENGFVIERYLELERSGKCALHPLDIEDIRRRPDARELYTLMKEVPYWFVLKARKELPD
jgi:ubiquinone/menaquinone biosynthesis C-methylase UbiE